MKMSDNMRKSKELFSLLGLWILVGIMCLAKAEMVVLAAENSFFIEAEMVSSNKESYDILMTVENTGADWEGTVRLIVDEEYRYPSAYDTAISLPQGSTKQFVVKVPRISMEESDGTVWVSLWDTKDKEVADKEFKYLLSEGANALYMGILSDDYSALTYLDMGGEELYFYGRNYPVKLVELRQDNLVDSLETLNFLVIDNYNTGVLTQEELAAIELWNYNGGILVVGTGSYGENTLAGFEDTYLGIEYVTVYSYEEYDDYSKYYSDGVDFSQLPQALFSDISGQYIEQYYINALTCSTGNGAIGILPYSLTEMADMDETFYLGTSQEMFVMNMMDMISSESNTRYNNIGANSAYETADTMRSMLGIIGNTSSPLKFGVLKILIVLYVIFVGPILYLILRFTKKRELYWVAVPVTAFLGIVLVFFAGRGFEVSDTRVYSVTATNLSNTGSTKSYLYCYNANHKEWDLQLTGGYEYAGALMNNNYYYSDEVDDYYHHIRKEGDRLSFGIKPSSNFEDSYFYAAKTSDAGTDYGEIVCEDILTGYAGVHGYITNETGRDFPYFAVISEDTLSVYEGLAAGETCNLTAELPIYSSSQGFSMWSDYTYYFLRDYYEDEDEKQNKKAGILAALGVGIGSAYPETDLSKTVVVGVVENWDETVDDKCSEISYGCLYTIQ